MLHVAHSFVSALTCWRLDRPVGAGAVAAAALVGLSTLYTKQHYVLDVVAGVLLAFVAYLVFLRSSTPARRSDLDHRAAPILAIALLGLIAVLTGCCWVVWSAVGR